MPIKPRPNQQQSPPQPEVQTLLLEEKVPQSHKEQPDPHSSEERAKEERREERKGLNRKEQDWYDYFDKRFGPIIIIMLWFSMPLDRATFYAPQPDECHAMAPHMARIMPRIEDALNKLLHLPNWTHSVLISSDSTIQVGFILMGYLDRVGLLDKVAPYFTGYVTRMKTNVEENNGYTGPVQSTNGTGPSTVDLSSVRGLGEQWRP